MIEGLPVINLGAPALLSLVVLFILTDRLVWHKRLEALAKQIEVKDALIKEQAEQITLLMGSAIPTVNHVLTALHRAATEDELR